MTSYAASATVLGRPLALASLCACALGAAATLLSFPLGAAQSVLPGLACAALFFAGLAAGSVALSAAVRVAQGRFLEPALPFLESAAAFLPTALALLVASFALRAPQSAREGVWLSRDLVACAALYFSAQRVRRRTGALRWAEGSMRDSVVYLLVFAIAVSLWTFDLVMELYPGEPSGVVPAQAFVAAFVSAIAWAALLACWKPCALESRHDLGRMLFGFTAFWAYLTWCSFLSVWYANLPAASFEIVAPGSAGFRSIGFAIVALAFALPFLLLFTERAKRSRLPLSLAALGVLLGLLAERALLVLRPLPPPASIPATLAAALAATGLAGLFLLSSASHLATKPGTKPGDTIRVSQPRPARRA